MYTDSEKAAFQIKECFSLADRIVAEARITEKLNDGVRLRIVGTDSYSSYWSVSGENRSENNVDFWNPIEILAAALHWLKNA